MFSIVATETGVDITDDAGRSFGIELAKGDAIVIEGYGLREDSDARFDEDKRDPHIELKLTPEQSADALAALTEWLELLAARPVVKV